MKFDVQKWVDYEAGPNSGVILAHPSLGSQKSFEKLVKEQLGSAAWLPGVKPFIDNFAKRCDQESEQSCSTLVEAENGNFLSLHLSHLDLAKKSEELGNESLALLQWGHNMAKVVAKEKWKRAALIHGLELAQLRLVLEGFWGGLHCFDKLKSKQKQNDCTVVLIAENPAEFEPMLAGLRLQTAAMQQTLELVLSPANICTPEFFCNFAVEHAGSLSGVSATFWDEEKLEAEGMNLLLAVGRGSPEPSRLLFLEYNGCPESDEHIALVGKGVCFDSGGTNLKPSSSMKGMQYDMMGGAVVYGAFYHLASSGFRGNIRAYVPLVENLIGGPAIKTSDIVKSAMGLTVEIDNTDAEGRLILADTIYCALQKRPSLLLDCATLTGAAITALGEQCAAFYTNNDRVAELFAQASRETGEAAWRMPLFGPYSSYLESELADLCNIPKKNIGGGSVTAALFLKNFALPKKQNAEMAENSHTWLHLDLASWSDLGEHQGLGKNAQALGVRILSNFIHKYFEKA